MSRRMFAVSTIVWLAVAAPAWAAQVPEAPDAPPPQPQPQNLAKTSTFAYEMALRSAVLMGGQRLAQQAAAIVPQVVLATTEQPIVRGVKLEGWGFFFDVQAPDIQSSVMVWDMVNQSRGAQRAAVPPPGSPGGPERPVSATGTVEPDPMTASPVQPSFDPNRAYSNFVRDSLIDALLDSSAVLSLAVDDHLTIAASGIDSPGSNPLYQARKLILTIKGSDLQDLRQGRITRDQAKARIIESRF